MKSLSQTDVDNVYIYVADAVRWDALPEEVAARGAVRKSVAASIHSPTSFASLVTGRYLPAHGVTDFSCQIPESLFSLFDIDGFQTKFVNSIGVSGSDDPIYSVLNQPARVPEDPIDSVSEPFVVMERGQGGHAPYGDFKGTATEYFNSRRKFSIEEVQSEYYDGVKRDSETFLSRIDHLESEGLLEDTLVIYTSDHGELLGEGGMFGHNGPIRPELVYVPTVFIHPQLSDEHDSDLFGHTELLPTVLDILEINVSDPFDDPALGGERETAYSFYEKHHNIPHLPVSGQTRFDSVWSANGGYVYPKSSVFDRIPGLIGSLLYQPTKRLARKRFLQGVNSYLSRQQKFGTPVGDPNQLKEAIENMRESTVKRKTAATLTEDAQRRLEDLGYID